MLQFLRNVLVATVAMLLVQATQAYNEESPNYKWSPNYFGIRGGPVIYSGHLSTPRRVIPPSINRQIYKHCFSSRFRDLQAFMVTFLTLALLVTTLKVPWLHATLDFMVIPGL